MEWWSKTRWLRVTKNHPCPVCEHGRWCGFAADDPPTLICTREPSDKPTANGGWLHRLDGADVKHPSQFANLRKFTSARPSQPPPADFTSMWRRWLERTDDYHLDGFAMSLGVDTDALQRLGCAWTGSEWAFPMRDDGGHVIGIRLRDERGRKWAVKGIMWGAYR
jgi:hypothetical protein